MSTTLQGMLLSTADGPTMNAVEGNNRWFLDSGASSSVTGNRGWFVEYTALETPQEFNLTNLGTLIKAVGYGSICLNTKGGPVIVTNVKYMPNAGINLLSEGHFDRKGCFIGKFRGKATVSKDDIVIMSGDLQPNNLYLMDCSTKVPERQVVAATKEVGKCATMQDLEMLHRRFTHFSYDTLVQMIREGAMKEFGFSSITSDRNFPFCEACAVGKMKALPSLKYRQVMRRRHVLWKGCIWTHNRPFGSPFCGWGILVCLTFVGWKYLIHEVLFSQDQSRCAYVIGIR